MSRAEEIKIVPLGQVSRALLRQIEELSELLKGRAKFSPESEPLTLELDHDNAEKVKVVGRSIRQYLREGLRVVAPRGTQNIYATERGSIRNLSEDEWKREADQIRDCIIQRFEFLESARSFLLGAVPAESPLHRPSGAQTVRSVVVPDSRPSGGQTEHAPKVAVPNSRPGRIQRGRNPISAGAFDDAEAEFKGTVRGGMGWVPPPPPVPSQISEFRAVSDDAEAEFKGAVRAEQVTSVSTTPSPLPALPQAQGSAATFRAAEEASSAVTSHAPARPPNWTGAQIKEQLGLAKLQASLAQQTCFSWLIDLIQPGRRAAKSQFLSSLEAALSQADVRLAVLTLLDKTQTCPDYLKIMAGYCSRVAGVITCLQQMLRAEGHVSDTVTEEQFPSMRLGS